MGFGRKTPPPPKTDRVLNARNNLHQHVSYDVSGHRQSASCRCDTGVDHTTPRSEPATSTTDDKE